VQLAVQGAVQLSGILAGVDCSPECPRVRRSGRGCTTRYQSRGGTDRTGGGRSSKRMSTPLRDHSQINLTLGTYSHVVPELAEEAAERVGNALWGHMAHTLAHKMPGRTRRQTRTRR
jgi:hypothetical protein